MFGQLFQPMIKKGQILRKKTCCSRSVNEENCEDVWTTPSEVFAPLLPRSQHRVKNVSHNFSMKCLKIK